MKHESRQLTFISLCATVALVFIGAGCSSPSPFTPQPVVGLTPGAERLQPTQGFQALLASSRLIVGANRVPLGLIENGLAVTDANVHVRFFELTSGDAELRAEADAPFYGDNLGAAGVYVTPMNFDKPGNWGAEITAKRVGKPDQVARIGLRVLAQDTVPNIGDPAPRSKTLTLKDVRGDRRKLSTAAYDDRILHTISIADAVTSGKPTVILFATPAFCTSRVCGPSHQVVMSLAQGYLDKVNFIHVEVYKDFEKVTDLSSLKLSDAMFEWHLETEPWLFFVGKDGKIVERFEGGITSLEIVPEFLRFVGS